MKIIIGVLALALAVLGLRYVDLYLDNAALKDELVRKEQLHNQQLEEQKQDYLRQIENLEQFLVFNHNTNTSTKPGQLAQAAPQKMVDGSTSLQSFAEIRDSSLTRAVDQKYSIIFPGLSLPHEDEEKFRQLLVDRERVLGTSTVGYHSSQQEIEDSIRQQQALLAEIDGRIADLLGPEEAQQYELLKDSSYEQHQMNSFYEQLGGRGTLSQDNQRALLMAKLEQKQQFTSQLQEATAYLNNASAAERNNAEKKMQEALERYKENYLREARSFLTDEQFNALSEYEQMQFEEMWSSLEAGWRAQAQ
ncbi:hypothetical protein ACSV5M_11455 [Cellvibrio sp. ARAG 10.3]|uniref:hypothetical protein n=1 Tax=Cellvibrio sp. ARAG 10.3 TaxID=3451358 RepID=UPI003F461FC5